MPWFIFKPNVKGRCMKKKFFEFCKPASGAHPIVRLTCIKVEDNSRPFIWLLNTFINIDVSPHSTNPINKVLRVHCKWFGTYKSFSRDRLFTLLYLESHLLNYGRFSSHVKCVCMLLICFRSFPNTKEIFVFQRFFRLKLTFYHFLCPSIWKKKLRAKKRNM